MKLQQKSNLYLEMAKNGIETPINKEQEKINNKIKEAWFFISDKVKQWSLSRFLIEMSTFVEDGINILEFGKNRIFKKYID